MQKENRGGNFFVFVLVHHKDVIGLIIRFVRRLDCISIRRDEKVQFQTFKPICIRVTWLVGYTL